MIKTNIALIDTITDKYVVFGNIYTTITDAIKEGKIKSGIIKVCEFNRYFDVKKHLDTSREKESIHIYKEGYIRKYTNGMTRSLKEFDCDTKYLSFIGNEVFPAKEEDFKMLKKIHKKIEENVSNTN